MIYKAIVSAHIYLHEGEKDIEILSQVDNDEKHTDIFCDIDHALLDRIEPEFDDSGSYFFMAVVESEFVEDRSWEGVEYDVDHAVKVIKSVDDISWLTVR